MGNVTPICIERGTGYQRRVEAADTLVDASGNVIVTGGSTMTGDLSTFAPFTTNISGVTAPGAGTLGTDIDALSYPDGSTTGQKFEWTVPDDYDSGDIKLYVTYGMSTAVSSPNNQIRVETAAEIVDPTSGSIDAGTYSSATQTFTTLQTTSPTTPYVERKLLLTILEADVGKGFRIRF